MAGGQKFTKLDTSQAYQQLCLDEESQKYVVINTSKGLFCYNCLPFGISSAPGIFQRVIESLLQGIQKVVVYLNDIKTHGSESRGQEEAGLRDERVSYLQVAPLWILLTL